MGGLLPEKAPSEYTFILSMLIMGLLVFAIVLRFPHLPKVMAYPFFRVAGCERVQRETASWPLLESGHFVLHYEPGTDPEAARLVLKTAEECWKPVKQLLGGEAPERVPLIVYRDRQSLREGFGWGPEENAMGVYWAGTVRVLSPTDWVVGYGSTETAAVFRREGPMAHELAHLLIDFRARGNYPRWLTEGIAQQVEREVTGFAFRPVEVEKEGEWYSLAALDRSFDKLPDQRLAYRQSVLLVDYLSSIYGPGFPGDLLDALGRGYTINQALISVSGLSASRLEAEFRDWAKSSVTG